MQRDSTLGTIAIAAGLCVACSVVVSAFAVGLKGFQVENKKAFQQRNILEAAGFSKDDIKEQGVEALFENIETRLIDLETGDAAPEEIVMETYDQKKAAKDPKLSIDLPKEKQTFGFRRREKYSLAYVMKDGSKIQKVILPIYGKGLWSTLYGYIALEGDLNTIAGITFYDHKETPGLGGEVDSKVWKAQWRDDKLIAADDGQVKIEVIKGVVVEGSPNEAYQIDGLSGATITSRGVSEAVRYWVKDGFGPFLSKLQTEGSNG